MTLATKLILIAALVLSIFIPFGYSPPARKHIRIRFFLWPNLRFHLLSTYACWLP